MIYSVLTNLIALVEAKLLVTIQEFRSIGIPVTDYTPSRGQDKLSRVNAVSAFLHLVYSGIRKLVGRKK